MESRELFSMKIQKEINNCRDKRTYKMSTTLFLMKAKINFIAWHFRPNVTRFVENISFAFLSHFIEWLKFFFHYRHRWREKEKGDKLLTISMKNHTIICVQRMKYFEHSLINMLLNMFCLVIFITEYGSTNNNN